MSLHAQRVAWMPSPPLVPADDPFDPAQLDRDTFGDAELAREVLTLFVAQSTAIMAHLRHRPADAGELAHKLKGSARAIGARRVEAAAEAIETSAAISEAELVELERALADANAAITIRLRRS